LSLATLPFEANEHFCLADLLLRLSGAVVLGVIVTDIDTLP
jgi:hypothetical protein